MADVATTPDPIIKDDTASVVISGTDPQQAATDILKAALAGTPYRVDGEQAPEALAEPKATDTPAAEGDVKPEGEKAEEAPNPLLAFIAGDTKELEIPEAVAKFFQDSGLGDASEVIKTLPVLRKEAEASKAELEKTKKELDLLENLSPEAKNVIAMDLEGKDWRKEVASRPSLDWRLTFDKQDKRAIADAYAKGKITQEEWEDYTSDDPDPTNKKFVDAVLEGAKTFYEKDRDNVVSGQTKAKQEREEQVAKHQASLNASLEHVFATVPGSRALKDEIVQSVTDLHKHFYEDDGVSLKPDAAFNAWFLKNRDAILGASELRMRKRAQDDATLSTLRRAEEKKVIPMRGNSAAPPEKTPEQQAREVFDGRLKKLGA